MESAQADILRGLSVHSLSGLLPTGENAKCGYLCQLQTRKPDLRGNNSIDELYFSIHWAILHGGHLFLFDSSISQSCTETIRLAGSKLEHMTLNEKLWPPFCTQMFTLFPSRGAARQFGCNRSDDWWQRELTAAAAAGAATAGLITDEAALRSCLLNSATATRGRPVSSTLSQQNSISRQSSISQQNSISRQSSISQQNSISSGDAEASETNAYDNTQDSPPSRPQSVPVQPPRDQGGAQPADPLTVYDTCATEHCELLHNLASKGRTVSFLLDYVAAAIYKEEDADEDTLWSLLAESEQGTFLLTGFSQSQADQPTRIAVKADGFTVRVLPLTCAPGDVRVSLTGDYGRTFDCLEHLVFHYHMHPICNGQDSKVCLKIPYGYKSGCYMLPQTALFSTCLWTMGDAEQCSTVLHGATAGTYSLRFKAHNMYVLSVRTNRVIAKMTVMAAVEGGMTRFSLVNGELSNKKFGSLESLLVEMHSHPFSVKLDTSRISLTLDMPFLTSPACRAKLQSLLLAPLRQQIFHRGAESQAEAALRMPAIPRGSFIVWLRSASEVVLIVRSGEQVVSKFSIVCGPTKYKQQLPQLQVCLERHPALRFDTVESLILHLKCNSGLLLPELEGTLLHPISLRSN